MRCAFDLPREQNVTLKTNIQEVISSLKIDSFRKGGENYDGLLRAVALTSLAEIKTRIHEEGKAADGADIGRYSTKPLYVNPRNSPKAFTPKGKTGRVKFESGKPLKTRYFADGYGGFKSFIGRNLLGKVNLSLSGQLNKQFLLFPTTDGWGLGWADDEKYTRAIGLERKYRREIYNLTDEEEQKAVGAADKYIEDAISKGAG